VPCLGRSWSLIEGSPKSTIASLCIFLKPKKFVGIDNGVQEGLAHLETAWGSEGSSDVASFAEASPIQLIGPNQSLSSTSSLRSAEAPYISPASLSQWLSGVLPRSRLASIPASLFMLSLGSLQKHGVYLDIRVDCEASTKGRLSHDG
jgi:hypothetical protein